MCFCFIFVALHSSMPSSPCPKFLMTRHPPKLLSSFNSLSPPPDLPYFFLEPFFFMTNSVSILREVRCPSPRGIWVNFLYPYKWCKYRCLRLTNFLMPWGNSLRETQLLSFSVNRFSNLVMELGRNSICWFQKRSRYLKCFNSPIEWGITHRSK